MTGDTSTALFVYALIWGVIILLALNVVASILQALRPPKQSMYAPTQEFMLLDKPEPVDEQDVVQAWIALRSHEDVNLQRGVIDDSKT